MEEKISKGTAQVIDLVMPGQANHYGTLFGGLLIAYMDKAAYIAANRYCKSDCVTVAVDNVVFDKPVKVGETVVVTARLIYVGSTSMLVRVSAESETGTGERKLIVGCADFLFVAVDKRGKPFDVPRPLLETEEEKSLFERGREIKNMFGRQC